MGQEADVADAQPKLTCHLSHLTWDTFPNYIRDAYGFDKEPELMELIEQLDGTVWRDQRQPVAFETLTHQRRSLHKLARVIRDEASKTVVDIERLKRVLADFERVIEPTNWSAVMLEEVFDIPFVPSTAVDAPEVFDPLRIAMANRNSPEEEFCKYIKPLRRLPVRATKRTNKVRNHALEKALITCRAFWERHPSKGYWTRCTLGHSVVDVRNAKGEHINPLAGECERFVFDMLTAAGVDFTLTTLNGAWSALDKRNREGARHGE